jgi:hypothetical protein
MNFLLASVAFFLISLKRTIVLDRIANTVSLTKRSLWTRRSLTVEFPEIAGLRLGTDQVYGGFAVAGSTAGVKSFPASSLRLLLSDGETVLLDRGGKKRLGELADLLGRFLTKPVAES